jgi:hypothetical protein
MYLTAYCYTHASAHSNVFTAVAWYRFKTADVPSPLDSQTTLRPQLQFLLVIAFVL